MPNQSHQRQRDLRRWYGKAHRKLVLAEHSLRIKVMVAIEQRVKLVPVCNGKSVIKFTGLYTENRQRPTPPHISLCVCILSLCPSGLSEDLTCERSCDRPKPEWSSFLIEERFCRGGIIQEKSSYIRQGTFSTGLRSQWRLRKLILEQKLKLPNENMHHLICQIWNIFQVSLGSCSEEGQIFLLGEYFKDDIFLHFRVILDQAKS